MGAAVVLLAACTIGLAADEVTISAGRVDANGFAVHEVRSPYQSGTTRIRVLSPKDMKPGEKVPVVYVLPVEAKDESRYGDGLLEAKTHDLANRHHCVFVAPTFSHLPWYADHPTDAAIRQESYFLKVVLPFVEKAYPVTATAEGRFLLGFSKSGWGAFSLILRHPDTFARAAAWDAPHMMDAPGKYGSGPIFGTKENFAAYHVSKLLEANAATFRTGDRLLLTGSANFRKEHDAAHDLMRTLRIAHIHVEGQSRKHDWHSGWVAESVKMLLEKPK